MSTYSQSKKERLSDYLLFNGMTVCFSDDEENTLYLQEPNKQPDNFAETIVTLMEAINFIVILDGKAHQIEGCFYSPPEGFYAELPPLCFKTELKLQEKTEEEEAHDS